MNENEVQIVVLTGGFVYVGKTVQRNGYIEITDAKNIRRWGTSGGLGELALKGPQANTIIDDTGTVRAPLNSLIFLIDCKGEVWQRIFD